MISYLLIILLTLCGAISISFTLNKKIGWSILLYFLSVIFLLYVLGIFIPLNIATYIIIVLTILSFIFTISKKKKDTLNIFKIPTLYMFLIITIFLFLIDNGKGIYMIDEYTHWGDVVYAMYQNNTLSVFSANDLWYASYPPTISLFQYFIMIINNAYSEGLLYFSYQLFGLALFLPFIDKIKLNKKISFIMITIITIVMPLMLFGNYYNSIYVDAILGLLFGFTFVYPFIYKKIDKLDILILSLSLFALTLLKDAGIFFSLISLVNMFIILNKDNKKRFFTTLAILLGTILLAKCSWSLMIYLNDIVVSHKGTFTIKSLIDFLIGNGSEFQKSITEKFISAFSSTSILTKPLNLTYFSLTMLLALIIYFTYRNENNKSILLLIIGAFIYMAGLLIIFMFNFDKEEALGLLSYDRYSIIYLNGLLFFTIISLIIKNQDIKKLTFIFILILFFIPTGTLTNLIYNNTDKNRNEFVNQVSKLNKNNKVIIYSAHYQKYEYAKYHYLLKPIKLTENCEKSCITANLNKVKEKNYDYLYIDKMDSGQQIDNIKLKEHKWYKINNNKIIVDK